MIAFNVSGIFAATAQRILVEFLEAWVTSQWGPTPILHSQHDAYVTVLYA